MQSFSPSSGNNMLGLSVGPIHVSQSPYTVSSATSRYPDLNQSGQGFLAMMQDDYSMGESMAGPALQCASTPARSLVRADGRPLAPLPRTPRAASPVQMLPHVETSHGSAGSRASTPMLAPALLAQRGRPSTSKDAPLPSSPSIGLGASASQLFSRSFSAPLATPRRSSVQLNSHLSSVTCASTPVAPMSGSASAVFSPRWPAILGTRLSAHSPLIASQPGAVGMPGALHPDEPLPPFADDHPESDMDTRSHRRSESPINITSEAVPNNDNGFLVAASEFPPMKRTRLMNPASFAPTTREIADNKRREYRSIQKGRKYNVPKGKNAEKGGPKVGVNVGIFGHQEQGYMRVMRASMTFDLVGYSPWNEAEADMRRRAIALADEGTGMKGDNFVSGEFEKTVRTHY